MLLRTLLAFVRRDAQIEVSYRTSFILQFFGILFTVLLWYFIAGVLQAPKDARGLEGLDYFSYVLVGVAVSNYLTTSMTAFAAKVRNEQVTGTLEAMLVTPAAIGAIVLGSALWDFLLTSLKVVVYLLVGWFFFGVALRAQGLLPGLLILVLTVLAFSGIGILSAAFILYLKRGDPITYLVATGSALLGGVFFPPELMPPWLSRCSAWLPITYALRGLRRALLRGSGMAELWPDVQALAVFAVLLVPLGALAFRLAVRKARQEGSLVQY